MLRLVIFVLAVYGAVAAVTILRIGAPLRLLGKKLHAELEHFLSCPACVGFWLGCLMSAHVFPGPALATHCGMRMDLSLVMVDGFLACGSCWIIHVVLVRLGMYEI